jgi:hypothetical protein
MTDSQSRDQRISSSDTPRSLHCFLFHLISMQSTVASSYFDSASDGTSFGRSLSESILSSLSFVRDEIDGSHTLPDIAEGSYEPHTSDSEPTTHIASAGRIYTADQVSIVSLRAGEPRPALRRRERIIHESPPLTASSLLESDRCVPCPSDRADR